MDFSPRFARIEVANDKGLAMIEKAATDIYTFDCIGRGQNVCADKPRLVGLAFPTKIVRNT